MSSLHQVRNILLSLGRERLLIARPTPESDDYNFPLSRAGSRPNPGARSQQGAAQRQTRGGSQKLAPVTSQLPSQLLWRGGGPEADALG